MGLRKDVVLYGAQANSQIDAELLKIVTFQAAISQRNRWVAIKKLKIVYIRMCFL